MNKFQNVLKKNKNIIVRRLSINLIFHFQPQLVKELFPDDEDLYEKLLSNYNIQINLFKSYRLTE